MPEYAFPDPWESLRDEAHGRGGTFVRELRVELGPDHPWYREEVEAVAAFTRQDEVLFRVGGEYAIVHLTWAQRHDPSTRVRRFADWAAVTAEVEHMAENW